jgi:membrane fusion protein (multidrug efflux system)
MAEDIDGAWQRPRKIMKRVKNIFKERTMKRVKLSRVFSCPKALLQACLFKPLCLTMLNALACEKKKTGAPEPPVVEVVQVIQKDVPIYEEWVGTADGFVNATIRAQVQGYLIKQNYKEGDLVRKGQTLFEIDPRTFQAALEQTKGQLAVQQASWDTAKANLKRIKPLAEQNAVSQKDLDDAVGKEQASHASVLAAKAAVDKAELELGFTKITSPVDGIAGVAKAQIGNLVGPGATEELTTVSTVDPIKVYVQISEQEYLKAMETKKQPRKTPLELILADGTVFPHKGEFSFADREVDVRTGTIKIATLFQNPGNLLRPGQFTKVRAETSIRKNALLIPQRAVTEMQGNYLVAVVSADNKVTIRPVKVGQWSGTLWIINEGLKPGEKVVAEGTQKVKDGITVTPKPFGAEMQPKGETTAIPEKTQSAPAKPVKR